MIKQLKAGDTGRIEKFFIKRFGQIYKIGIQNELGENYIVPDIPEHYSYTEAKENMIYYSRFINKKYGVRPNTVWKSLLAFDIIL